MKEGEAKVAQYRAGEQSYVDDRASTALFGFLPQHHMSDQSKDIVKLRMGVVGTM